MVENCSGMIRCGTGLGAHLAHLLSGRGVTLSWVPCDDGTNHLSFDVLDGRAR